jgi:phosphonate transport system substrate-binding protein
MQHADSYGCRPDAAYVLKTLCLVFFLAFQAGIVTPVLAGQKEGKQASTLRFGVLPYLSSRALVHAYAPLVDYLQSRLQRPVMMVTAPDFKVFAQRSSAGRYDFVFTAPHFAKLGETRGKLVRLSKVSRKLDGEIVVSADSKIKSVADLRGHTFATPDYLAVVTILGEELLELQQFTPDVDIFLHYTPSHNNALLSVAEGTAAAGIAVGGLYAHMPENINKNLRILDRTRAVPHSMFMAHSNLDPESVSSLRTALVGFRAAGAGKVFFGRTGFGDMETITDEDMNALEPLVNILKARLHRE